MWCIFVFITSLANSISDGVVGSKHLAFNCGGKKKKLLVNSLNIEECAQLMRCFVFCSAKQQKPQLRQLTMPKNIQLPQKGAAKLDIRLHETLLKFKDPYSLSSFFSIQTVENRKPIVLVLRRS